MHLYLVRHATPAATTGDPDLGETGREEAARLAALFGRLGLPAGGTAVLASSARRARQTAGPIAAAVGLAAGAIQAFPPPAGPVPTSPGDLALALARLAPASEHVVLVGHWGTVNTLYGWLVGVPAAAFPQAYAAAAAVACEAPFAEKGGQVRWLVSPAVLPGAGATTGGVTRLGAVEFGGGVRNPTDVSAIDAADDWLVIGADETNLVQLLKRGGTGTRSSATWSWTRPPRRSMSRGSLMTAARSTSSGRTPRSGRRSTRRRRTRRTGPPWRR